jgi:hypothetical protein
LIKNNNHTQFFKGHDLPSRYVNAFRRLSGHLFIVMSGDSTRNAASSGKIVFWNNVKLQQIAKRHNRRCFGGLIARNERAILCKESLRTKQSAFPDIVHGNSDWREPTYSPVSDYVVW